MRTAWAGLNVQPGDRVRSRTHGEGVVGGRLYPGPGPDQMRLVGSGGGTVVLGAGSLEVVEPAPVFEVGETAHTPRGSGPVLERWEREDAPGYMYRVQTGTTAAGEPRSTVVGPEKMRPAP